MVLSDTAAGDAQGRGDARGGFRPLHRGAKPGAAHEGAATVRLARWAKLGMLSNNELSGANATVHRLQGFGSENGCSALTICPSRAWRPVIYDAMPSCGAKSQLVKPARFSHFLSFHCETFPRAPALGRVFPLGSVRLLSPTAFMFAIGEDKVASVFSPHCVLAKCPQPTCHI